MNGFQNLGLTCYVNSILQALLGGVQDFGPRVVQARREAKQGDRKVPMTNAVARLYHHRQKGRL